MANKKYRSTPAPIPIQKVTSDKPALKNVNKDGKEKGNRGGVQLKFDAISLIYVAISVVIYIIIRNLFPIPDFTADTRGYVYGAINNSEISYRPLGYSYFLRWIHNINPSAEALVNGQFIIMLLSILFFAHVLKRVLPLNKLVTHLLNAFLFVNPALIQLANFILTDSVFASFTIILITLIIIYVQKPSWILLGLILLMNWMCLTIRYNALIYPLITCIIFLWLMKKSMLKWVGLGLGILIPVIFYFVTVNTMENQTGYRMFSGFSGWQMASNAMDIYKASSKRGITTTEPELKSLDSICIKYIDSATTANASFKKGGNTGFMFDTKGPFHLFLNKFKSNNPQDDAFQRWVATSAVLNKYGQTVIEQYPMLFINSYIIPNIVAFFVPDIECLGTYEATTITLFPTIREWYQIPEKIENKNIALPKKYNQVSAVVFTLLSVLFPILIVLFFIRRKVLAVSEQVLQFIQIVGVFWVIKFGFDILASPITFRYTILLMPLLTGAVAMMLFVLFQTKSKEIVDVQLMDKP